MSEKHKNDEPVETHRPKRARLLNPAEPIVVETIPPINTLDELVAFCECISPKKVYNVDVLKLKAIHPTLVKLKNTIGMTSVKQAVVDQIMFFMGEFQKTNSDMIHTVIQGPPGVGKTMFAELLAELYHNLGVIEKPPVSYEWDEDIGDYVASHRTPRKFTVAKRADLIAKYLGQTAPKTQKVIDDALGGVLFIDEAYSLGSPENRDSFAKECVDCINQNLSEKKNQIVVIIAGYKEALDQCFFAQNEGLRRRFPFVYTIDGYTPSELRDILLHKIKEMKWSCESNNAVPVSFFEAHKDEFPHYGGDIEALLLYMKIQHAKRVFGEPIEKRGILTFADLETGFSEYVKHREKKKNDSKVPWLYT